MSIGEFKKFPKDYEGEDKTRAQIQEVVTSKINDATKARQPVINDPPVKDIVGSGKLCWGCFIKMSFIFATEL